ncbi:MAG: hypothetical protein QOI69_1680, partial [Pseudonocardiales bacterium]|nr:hypothetical protein [Pseudonocardiales bacterium]
MTKHKDESAQMGKPGRLPRGVYERELLRLQAEMVT